MAARFSTRLRNTIGGINTNLVANGSFDSATTGWTAGSATLTSEASGQAGNCLRIAETGGANPGTAYQDITTKVGHVYKLTLYFKKGTAAAGAFYIGTTGDADAFYSSGALTDAAWAQKTCAFVATATTTRITLESTDATATEYCEFDTVVCVDKSNSLQEAFYLGLVKVYSGTQPASPDDAPTGTLLCTFSNGGGGTGVTFNDSAAGVLSKNSTETWSGTCVADGTAGWFRLVAAGDGGDADTDYTDCRIDGTMATSGGEGTSASLAYVTSSVQTISAFTVTIPLSV